VVKNGTSENLYVGGTSRIHANRQTIDHCRHHRPTGNLGVGYLNTHWQGQIAEVIVLYGRPD